MRGKISRDAVRQAVLLTKVVRVEHDLDLRAGDGLDQIERIVQRRQKRPLGGATGMHGLHRQRHSQLGGQRGKIGQRP